MDDALWNEIYGKGKKGKKEPNKPDRPPIDVFGDHEKLLEWTNKNEDIKFSEDFKKRIDKGHEDVQNFYEFLRRRERDSDRKIIESNQKPIIEKKEPNKVIEFLKYLGWGTLGCVGVPISLFAVSAIVYLVGMIRYVAIAGLVVFSIIILGIHYLSKKK